MKPHEKHREAGKRRLRIRIAAVQSGSVGRADTAAKAEEAVEAELSSLGHEIVSRKSLHGHGASVGSEAEEFLGGSEDVLVLIGGTGMGRDEVTIETVRPMLEKEIVGFGELTRMLDSRAGGSGTVLLRAIAGVARGKLVICLPSSPAVVRRTLRAFAPEMPHVVFVARKTP